MSEHNIFQEIKEDLERQRLEALWKRYGVFVVVAALALVLGTAALSGWRSWHAERDQSATATLIDLLNPKAGDEAKQIDSLIEYAHKNNKLFQADLAEFHAAALASQQGKRAQAIEIYDSIAQDSHADIAFRQLADLRSIELQLDAGDPTILSKRLEALSTDQAPWRFTAMEYQGYLALHTGDKAKAHDIFTSLSQNVSAPAALSQRASDILHSMAE